ncbi:uncharacterized protein [Ptychodera flava]|uniref:uncharacterized protein isoform X2 n=2 Tax=Ptychodera flava TaxID=63121 RepID=UPI00396A71BF
MVNNYKSSDGWKLHNDGHVNKVQLSKHNDNFTYVRGVCVRETEQQAVYKIWIILEENNIMSSSCECPADDQACKHVAALLFGLWSFTDRHQDRHTLVGTDIACTWDCPKKAATPQLLDDIDVRTNRSTPLIKPILAMYQPVIDMPDDLEKRWKHASSEDSLAIRYLSGSSSSDSDTDEEMPTFLELCKKHNTGGLESLLSELHRVLVIKLRKIPGVKL